MSDPETEGDVDPNIEQVVLFDRAVIATRSECSALPQNGTENDEPESRRR